MTAVAILTISLFRKILQAKLVSGLHISCSVVKFTYKFACFSKSKNNYSVH